MLDASPHSAMRPWQAPAWRCRTELHAVSRRESPPLLILKMANLPLTGLRLLRAHRTDEPENVMPLETACLTSHIRYTSP